MDESSLLTVEWGFYILLTIVVALVGYFVKRVDSGLTRRTEQVEEISQRVIVLEERERGSATQTQEMKTTIDKLATDMRFVRENIVVLLNKSGVETINGG
jgi:hypothetical protein